MRTATIAGITIGLAVSAALLGLRAAPIVSGVTATAAPRLIAGTPDANATPTPEPTATPYPPGTTLLRVRVVDDGNGNGVVDAGDSGLQGWEAVQACGDALSVGPPTDANGSTLVRVVTSTNVDGVMTTCVWLRRLRGWLPTSPTVLNPPITEGQMTDVTFLLRYLGDSVMETQVSVVIRGIPTVTAVTAASPFAQCVEHPNGTVLMIVGAADRQGCPEPGDSIRLLVDGSEGGRLVFAPGQDTGQDLVVGGDSMRFWFTSEEFSDGSEEPPLIVARVNSMDCAVVDNVQTLGGGLAVYVLSDEARAGCGRPGDVVRVYRDGALLEPQFAWHPGWLSNPPSFTAAETTIVPPDTGSAGLLAAD